MEEESVKEYFTIGSEKWKAIVKYALITGFCVGLLCGVIILFDNY